MDTSVVQSLAGSLEEHARKFGLEIVNAEFQHARRAGDRFSIRTDQGEHEALAILGASGGSPVKLGVAGEEEFLGRGVSYCAVCDGAFFAGREIVVVGGGDSAVQEAIFLTRFGSSVTLIHRRDRLRAQTVLQQQLQADPKVHIIYGTVIERIAGSNGVERVHVRNVQTDARRVLPASGVFIFIGFRPNTWFLPEHLAHDASGYLLTNERMETNIEGIFAAGDVRAQLLRQVSTAVGDGTVTALAAEQYISRKKSGTFDVRDWWYAAAADTETARPRA